MLIQTAPPATRISRANLAGLGASASVAYAKQGASVGASVGSVVPVLGTAVGAAIGAVVGAIGGAFIGSRRPESDLWDQYKKIAGQQRGIELDPNFRAGAFVGLMRLGKNTFPPRAKGGYGPKDDARFLDDMAAQISAAVRAGKVTAADDARSVFAKVVGPWISQWGVEPHADWKRWEDQIVTDLIDAYLYDLPIVATSYTSQRWAQPRLSDVVKQMQPPAPTPTATAPAPSPQPAPNPPAVTLPATPAPAPAPIPAVVPSSSSSTPAAPSSSSSSSAPPAPSITPAVADNTRALIDAVLAQGASTSQALTAAMQSLASQGVAPTPQLQEAVAQEVQSSAASTAGFSLPGWTWPAVLAAVGLSFALARPAPAPRARRRSRR